MNDEEARRMYRLEAFVLAGVKDGCDVLDWACPWPPEKSSKKLTRFASQPDFATSVHYKSDLGSSTEMNVSPPGNCNIRYLRSAYQDITLHEVKVHNEAQDDALTALAPRTYDPNAGGETITLLQRRLNKTATNENTTLLPCAYNPTANDEITTLLPPAYEPAVGDEVTKLRPLTYNAYPSEETTTLFPLTYYSTAVDEKTTPLPLSIYTAATDDVFRSAPPIGPKQRPRYFEDFSPRPSASIIYSQKKFEDGNQDEHGEDDDKGV
ncbi:hypothetical protein G6011_00870 [Alternaria panax]|uniref:Uncharacterized protein n=1 Tax=Alternaria panax TaxID=48097 RepID=A0AAD4IJP3_9PLEO|nr:hypothetical protein G6011_00870 [Alternaria panax]